MSIQVLNSERFFLKGTGKSYVHVATLGKGLKEYMVLLDTRVGTTYIEEITGGSLKAIEEDEEWNELVQFAKEHSMMTPRSY